MALQKITPFIWFNDQAEEAVDTYTKVFRQSRIGKVTRYGKEGQEVHGQPEGRVMTIEFELEGQSFSAINGGPTFTPNEAISFVVHCDDQNEVDYYWNALSDGGDPAAQQCGWLKDRFGLSWQIVPRVLPQLLADSDRDKAGRVMSAMLKMKKIDIATLEAA